MVSQKVKQIMKLKKAKCYNDFHTRRRCVQAHHEKSVGICRTF